MAEHADAAREAARQDNGQFGTQPKAEAPAVELIDEDRDFPRRGDGSIDAAAAVAAGTIKGFSTKPFDEPKTVSMHGHWEGNTIVVESIYDGDIEDERPETYYWSEGLWASSATGSSDADIAASMLDEYEESHTIRVAETDDEMTPAEDDEDEACRADDCDESLDDGEGYDGYCGTHADKVEKHEHGGHRPVGRLDDDGDPTEGPDDDCPEC